MEVLYKKNGYTITVGEKPNANAIELLHTTLWGTNGPIFEHLDTHERIIHISGSLAFSLEKNGKTISTCTVLERNITVEGKEYKTWYGRYFAVDKDYQGKMFGNILLKEMKNYLQKISNLPTIFYAYVDQANPRSRKLLLHTGFKVIRRFETSVFSRMYPKHDPRVSKISKPEDIETILSLLKKQNENNTFLNFDNLFFQHNYFILKEGNEIVSGIQASITKWKIQKLPGFSGKVIIKILPYIPFISRLFNPKDFRFAAFEGIYCKKGHEKDLFKLMESACAQLELFIGMIWLDPEMELSKRIKNAGDWGLMNRMREDLPAHVVAGFYNVSETEQELFHKKPVYISAFDLT
ncbi:MAG TPA: GNAT family N-acetyltransferase [Bacteroidia bacterium]|nr:GNAT family N-acetyltransferase [Bacteroidia bacterium]